MNIQDKILSFLRTTGPTLPSKVAKNAETNTLLASAHLSDLASQGKVKISRLKIGGSPLYYLPGQEEQLYSFAAGNINGKDLGVLRQLKENKVLREINLELLAKVALRTLKDFAIPLQVTVANKKEIFWKWHLLSGEETNQIIKGYFTPPAESKEENVPAEEDQLAEQQKEVKEVKELKELKKEIKEEITEESIEKPIEEVLTKEKEELVEEKEEKEIQKPIEENEPVEKKLVETDLPQREKQKTLTKEQPIIEIKRKKPALKKIKEKIIRKKRVLITDEFSPQIESFFNEMDIFIEHKEIVRKNAEMNFLIRVSSAVGKTTYYCKAKQKKKCDQKDISSAYMEAQIKKLPLLFLYTNELTKKAEEMLESGAFENALIKKIE